MRTIRDSCGTDYSVELDTGDEQGSLVWAKRVSFGSTDATVAGGSAFRAAAREQQAAADEAWALSHKVKRAKGDHHG